MARLCAHAVDWLVLLKSNLPLMLLKLVPMFAWLHWLQTCRGERWGGEGEGGEGGGGGRGGSEEWENV